MKPKQFNETLKKIDCRLSVQVLFVNGQSIKLRLDEPADEKGNVSSVVTSDGTHKRLFYNTETIWGIIAE